MRSTRKAVIFDRDGTLIIDKIYLNDPNGIEYLPNVFEALRTLRDHGYEFAVATNQSGVPKGIVQVHNLDETHRRMRADFARQGVMIRGFYYAPFLPGSTSIRRKPQPGMMLEAAHDFGFNLSQSWMVGDRYTDVQAGHHAGMKTGFLLGTETLNTSHKVQPTVVANNLIELVRLILKHDSI